MNSFNKKKKGNNRGFSLVEVLLAVVLLGLIAAPLLQMFYSSMALNQKSKKYMAAADLAQLKLEEISARTWEDSTPLMSGATEVAGVTTGISTDPNFFAVGTTDFSSPITGTVSDYGGYSFAWSLSFIVPDDAASKEYYSVKAVVKVMDPENGNEVISKASTEIPSKH